MNEDSFLPPGITDQDSTREWQGLFGRPEWQWHWGNQLISGASRDSGGSPTTTLRRGMLMGKITSTKLWVPWAPTATDGSQYLRGILLNEVDTQRAGANQNRMGPLVAQHGGFKAANLLIPGESTYGLSGKDLEFLARNAMNTRFVLDDYNVGEIRQRTVTADVTLDYLDHYALIDNLGAAGAVNVTLPTPKRGLVFRFAQIAGQNIVLASSASNEFIPQSGTPATSFTCSSTVYGIVTVTGISTTQYLVDVDDT